MKLYEENSGLMVFGTGVMMTAILDPRCRRRDKVGAKQKPKYMVMNKNLGGEISLNLSRLLEEGREMTLVLYRLGPVVNAEGSNAAG